MPSLPSEQRLAGRKPDAIENTICENRAVEFAPSNSCKVAPNHTSTSLGVVRSPRKAAMTPGAGVHVEQVPSEIEQHPTEVKMDPTAKADNTMGHPVTSRSSDTKLHDTHGVDKHRTKTMTLTDQRITRTPTTFEVKAEPVPPSSIKQRPAELKMDQTAEANRDLPILLGSRKPNINSGDTRRTRATFQSAILTKSTRMISDRPVHHPKEIQNGNRRVCALGVSKAPFV